MKVLVMGGTAFNGLALVRELVRTGHDVTIVNRGQTKAAIPRSVRRLYADRTDHAQLREVLGKEEFDCVQDISAYRLEDVQLMAEIFSGRTGHYIFASSTVIYAPSRRLPIHEDFPVDRSEDQNEYGTNKLLCEDFLFRLHREQGFPATIAAFSMVFGPNNIIPDREQRMFMRLLQGRKIMIPGDGTTVGQVGHVDDEARALRMMMREPVTFGKRYNLTGSDYYTDEGYVDTFAEIVGQPADKVFIPATLMDDLYAGNVAIEAKRTKANIDIRTKEAQRAVHRYQIATLIQRLAPNLHHWSDSVFFGVDALRRDVGWEPEYTFRSAVEQTWEWFVAEGLDKTSDFDFAYEDRLLEMIGS